MTTSRLNKHLNAEKEKKTAELHTQNHQNDIMLTRIIERRNAYNRCLALPFPLKFCQPYKDELDAAMPANGAEKIMLALSTADATHSILFPSPDDENPHRNKSSLDRYHNCEKAMSVFFQPVRLNDQRWKLEVNNMWRRCVNTLEDRNVTDRRFYHPPEEFKEAIDREPRYEKPKMTARTYKP